MKISDLKIGDIFGYHSQPKDEFGQIISYSIQHSTQNKNNHIGICLADASTVDLNTSKIIIGALSEGFTKQTINDAVISGVDTVTVYRYHADRDELTPTQQQGLVKWCEDHEGCPYDFLDILLLALLMEINDTSWESNALRATLSMGLGIADTIIMGYLKTYKVIADALMGKSVNTNNGMLICSCAGYAALTIGAGVTVNLLNSDARENFYKLNGDISDRFKAVNSKDLLTTPAAFVTPRDLSMSPDLTDIGILEI